MRLQSLADLPIGALREDFFTASAANGSFQRRYRKLIHPAIMLCLGRVFHGGHKKLHPSHSGGIAREMAAWHGEDISAIAFLQGA
jgi:hypothetical protein